MPIARSIAGRRRRAGRRRTRPSPAPRAPPPARAAVAARRSPRRAGSGSTPPGSTPAPPPAARRRARSRRRRPRAPAASAWWTMSAGIGVRGEQGLEDLAVEATSRGDRDARPDRVPCQLVPEADVRGDRPRAAAGAPAPRPPTAQSGITASSTETCRRGSARPRRARRGDARRSSSRDARPRTAFATEGGSVGGGPRGQQLGDVERIPAGRRVDLVRRRRRRARRPRSPTGVRARARRSPRRGSRRGSREADDPAAPRRPGRSGRAAPAGTPIRRPSTVIASKRRIVRPVHVLEHEHGRPRRELELRDQQRLDVVRRRAGRERLLERRRDAPDEVANRTQRPRNREVVAGADQHPRPGSETLDEPGDERGLARSPARR